MVVKKSLVTFVNKHLNKINLEVNDLDSQFADGVYLCLLSGLLEGYFVPLYDFHLTPQSFDEKVANVSLAFELMMDGGLPQPKARLEGVFGCVCTSHGANKSCLATCILFEDVATSYSAYVTRYPRSVRDLIEGHSSAR